MVFAMIDTDQKSFKLSDTEFNYIRKLVYTECGISLHEGKKELVRSRLSKRLRELNLQNFKEYKRILEESGKEAELINLLNAISTNLTSFFREKKHFNFLENKGLPNILKTGATKRNQLIKGWSAGCSTGEEPYTISMVISSWLESYSEIDFKITATDISTDVLSKAKSAVYEEARIKGIDRSILKKYFKRGVGKKKGFVKVKKNIREKIDFKRFNLMHQYSFGENYDFVFCRNVMIYFEKKIQAEVVNKFYDILRPGGYLFVGHSESLMNIPHRFKYVEPTIYQK